MRLVRSVLFLAAGLLALPGCDIFGPGPGSFDVSVTGDVTTSFSGEPVTIINPDGMLGASERRYQFRLAVPGFSTAAAADRKIVSVSVGSEGGPELVEGTYPIGRLGVDFGPGQAEATASPGRTRTFLSLSGTLTLTEVMDDRVRGSFEFEAVADGEEITVTGSFEADLDENAIS